MKKTLLLMFALVASLSGAWAQDLNVALDATISLVGDAVSFYTVDDRETPVTVTVEGLGRLVDGNKGNNYRFGGSAEPMPQDADAKTLAAQTFILDFGEVKNDLRSLHVYFTNAKARGFRVEYSENGEAWSTWVEETTNSEESYSNVLAETVSARYLKFVPTEASTLVWGIAIKELEVIADFTPAVTSISLSNKFVAAGEARNITATALDQLGEEYTGEVTYTVSPSTGASVSGNTISFTSEAIGTYTITANGSVNALVYLIGKPSLTNGGDDIELIQSGKTRSGEGTGYDGGYTSQTDWNLDGTKIFHAKNVRKFYMTDPGIDKSALEGYTKLHLKIFSSVAKNGVVVNMEGIDVHMSFNVPAGEWATLEVPFTGGSKSTSWIWVKFTEPSEPSDAEILVTDMYFSKEEPSIPFNITSDGVVTGDVTSENVAAINACTSAVINLSSAIVKEAITVTPSNTNAIVVVSKGADGRTPGQSVTTTNGNLVVFGGAGDAYYRAASGHVITINDDNAAQPNYGFTIDAQADGYVINRTIPAGKYVTTALPVGVSTAKLEGIDVYDFTKSSTGYLTFVKKETSVMAERTPYVLYSATGATLTTGTVKNDLNITSTSVGGYTQDDVTFQGTLAPITTNGSQWILSNGEIYQADGATIGSFRAYFTGLTVSARAAFLDGETTKIGVISANGEMEVGEFYNLRGQRVQNPTKGLYIVNGKKVVIK